MPPKRVTRSSNNSLPRRRYDKYGAATVAESSAPVSSDDESDESNIQDLSAAQKRELLSEPKSKAKANLKNKAATKLASGKGRTAAAKKQPATSGQNQRGKTPTQNFVKMFNEVYEPSPEPSVRYGQSPDVELPEIAASTYAQSVADGAEGWNQLSDNIMSNDQDDNDEAGNDAYQPDGWSVAIEALQGALSQEQQSQGAQSRSLSSMSRTREPSAVWPFPDNGYELSYGQEQQQARMAPPETPHQAQLRQEARVVGHHWPLPAAQPALQQGAGVLAIGRLAEDWLLGGVPGDPSEHQVRLRKFASRALSENPDEDLNGVPHRGEKQAESVSPDESFEKDREAVEAQQDEDSINAYQHNSSRKIVFESPTFENHVEGSVLDDTQPMQVDAPMHQSYVEVAPPSQPSQMDDQVKPSTPVQQHAQPAQSDDLVGGSEAIDLADDDGILDVDFGTHAPPKNDYDVEDSEVEDEAHSERSQKSLFVEDAPLSGPVARSDRDEGHSEDMEDEDELPEAPTKRRPFTSSGVDKSIPHETPSPRRTQQSQSDLYILPDFENNCTKAVVATKIFSTILFNMRNDYWSRLGKDWQSELLSGYNRHLTADDRRQINDERRKANLNPLPQNNILTPDIMWYNDHRQEVCTARARQMLHTIYRMWECCRQAPADIDEQVRYFRDGEGKKIIKTMELFQRYVSRVCSKLPTDPTNTRKKQTGKAMRQGLSYRLIPLLAILLKEVLLLASEPSAANPKTHRRDHVRELPSKVELIDWHLQMTLKTTSWMQRLCVAIIGDCERNPPDRLPENWDKEMDQRHHVKSKLVDLRKVLDSALEKLAAAANEPSRLAQAAENDRLARERREAQEKKRLEDQEQQYGLWMASLQATPSQRQVVPSQRQTFASQRHALSQGQTRQRQAQPSTRIQKKSTQRRRKLSELEKYAQAHDGWHWDEHNTLLTALKRVANPCAASLANSLKGRTKHDVQRRLVWLTKYTRDYYVRHKKPLPLWLQVTRVH